MSVTDELVIVATLVGPILAVQAQKGIERATERRRRKMSIFYTLMATRATRLAPDHVRALNQIDIEFRDESIFSILHWQGPKARSVSDAWRIYSDHLNENLDETEGTIAAWAMRGDALFIDLLFALSRYLGFPFDKVLLKRGVYSPRAHSEADSRQQAIQVQLLSFLRGEVPLKMDVVALPLEHEALERQRKLQELLLTLLSNEFGIPIEVRSHRVVPPNENT